jgi:prevent-host-death family protein
MKEFGMPGARMATAGGGSGTIPWLELVAEPVADTGTGRPLLPWKVSVRDLSRCLSRVLANVKSQCRPVVITHRGEPSWVVLPLDQAKFGTFLLSGADCFVAGKAELEFAEKRLRDGDVETLDQVLKPGTAT